MTNEELMKISEEKIIDRISIVTDDIFLFMREMTEFFRVGPWEVRSVRVRSGEALYHEAIVHTKTGIDLQIVEPVAEDTVYASFYNRFGNGIMGMRERVGSNDYRELKKKYEGLGVKTIEEDGVLYVDLMDVLGAVMSFSNAEIVPEPEKGEVHICQICLVTDDVLKMSHDMVEYLGIGPWEIGKANNNTFDDMQCGGYGPGEMPNPNFLVGIGAYGQIQVEIIEPKSGPVPYFGFLNRRGKGFHHIKQTLPKEEYKESTVRIKEMGLKPAIEGKISGCPWCNWATEDMFGFVFEMNDDSTFDALPEGYDPYFVQ